MKALQSGLEPGQRPATPEDLKSLVQAPGQLVRESDGEIVETPKRERGGLLGP